MTHKIKVQMFGNFRMDYNGAPFVAEKMHKESQFNPHDAGFDTLF